MYRYLFFATSGVAVFLALLLLLKKCEGDPCPVVVGKQVDTILVASNDSSGWIRPEPKERIVYKKGGNWFEGFEGPFFVETHDTLYTDYNMPVDTVAILADYLATYVYRDTQAVKYGRVIINDSVSQNRIKARQVTSSFLLPEIKEKITVALPKKIALYYGLEGMATQVDPFYAAGPQLGLMFKNDNLVKVSALYNRDRRWMFGAGLLFKLKLKKQ